MNKIFSVTLLSACLVLCLASAATCNTYYVDANSPNNPGAGTAVDPYRAISSAVALVIPGDIVEVAAGTYPRFTMNAATANIDVTFTAPSGATIDVTTAGGGPVQITAAENFTAEVSFEGFTFTGNAVNKVAGAGGGIKILSFLNCIVDSTAGGSGVTTGGGGPNRLTIDGCQFTAPAADQVGAAMGGDDGELTVLNSTFDNFGWCGLYSGGSVAYLELRNSAFTNPGGESVNMWALRGDAIVDRCYFHKARGGNDNFLIWGENAAFDVTITNSVFDYSTADADKQNLVCCAVTGKVVIQNCTVLSNNGAANHPYGFQIADNTDCEITNCIVVGSGTTDFNGLGAGTVLSNNWVTADGNPGFVSPEVYSPATYVALTGNLDLREDSPCRDAGIDVGITVDYDGEPRDATPDIGAYEYQIPQPTPTPEPPTSGVEGNWSLYQ